MFFRAFAVYFISQNNWHKDGSSRQSSWRTALLESPESSSREPPLLFSLEKDILPSFDPALFKAASALRRTQGAILVDVENVRGKSGFCLSHADVVTALARWGRVCGLQGRLSLVVDHGSAPSAYWLGNNSTTHVDLAILFAGPSRKADDVIAQDVAFLGQTADVTIVTADFGLMERCRRSAAKKGVHIVSPLHVLADLEQITALTQTVPVVAQVEDESSTTTIIGDSTATEDGRATTPPQVALLEEDMEYEIKLGAELLEAEALLRSKKAVQNRKRKAKLQAKVRKLREKLAMTPSVLKCVTDVLVHGSKAASLGGLTLADQTRLLQRWEKARVRSKRKEKTGDRVVLAELLRRDLQEHYGAATWNLTQTVNETSTASSWNLAHVLKVQAKLPKNVHSLLPTASSIRLVVVSDTHGFEQALTPGKDETLPHGDILLHLGDFAVDHGPNKKAALLAFDAWLAKQPHPTKIVVRGNHDPRALLFPQSDATYITRPVTMTIGGLVFAFCPHVAGGMSNRMAPRRCDVMCSHVPPKNLLDKCYSGGHAGSVTLRKAVEKMKTGPPVLWLCGHIHEARGILRHDFGGDQAPETLIINAANANPGMAEKIDHGPVVLQLTNEREDDHEDWSGSSIRRARRRRHGDVSVEIVSMDHAFTFSNHKDMGFFDQPSEHPNTKQLLVAVDLGLRTGLALYSEEGRLLEYQNAIYTSEDELRVGCLALLAAWEAKYQQVTTDEDDEAISYHISHVALEGADVALKALWRDMIHDHLDDAHILLVKPEEWRADLLLSKEKASGEAAKEASRLIARQLVADYGGRLHEGKFPTDVAEAVLLGYHVSRRLGWLVRKEPSVRRFTNGSVVVPKSLPKPILPSLSLPIPLVNIGEQNIPVV
jgi:predicted phosphodiesterase